MCRPVELGGGRVEACLRDVHARVLQCRLMKLVEPAILGPLVEADVDLVPAAESHRGSRQGQSVLALNATASRNSRAEPRWVNLGKLGRMASARSSPCDEIQRFPRKKPARVWSSFDQTSRLDQEWELLKIFLSTRSAGPRASGKPE